MEQITYGEVNEETATANARLIAAAPKMLAALQEIEESFWTTKPTLTMAETGMTRCGSLVELREAITSPQPPNAYPQEK